MHERFGDPASEIGSGSIDLAVILAGESTTSVGTPATVGIDDDLAAGQTGVTLRTANDEEAGWLNLRKSVIFKIKEVNCR